jgi:hypothetical protein
MVEVLRWKSSAVEMASLGDVVTRENDGYIVIVMGSVLLSSARTWRTG